MIFDYDDLLPLVDENGKIIGKELFSVAHEKRLLHVCVSVFAIKPNGKLILQLRSKFVGCPNTIDTTAAGHVKNDQTNLDAVICELEEEMNIKGAKLTELGKVIEKCKNEKPVHLTYFYVTEWNGEVQIDLKEVEAVIEMTFKELEEKLLEAPDKFAPGLKAGFPLLKKYLDSQ